MASPAPVTKLETVALLTGRVAQDLVEFDQFIDDFKVEMNRIYGGTGWAGYRQWPESAQALLFQAQDLRSVLNRYGGSLAIYVLNTPVDDDATMPADAWDGFLNGRDYIWQTIWKLEQEMIDLRDELHPQPWNPPRFDWDPYRWSTPSMAALHPAYLRGTTTGEDELELPYVEFTPIYRGRGTPIPGVYIPFRPDATTSPLPAPNEPPHSPREDLRPPPERPALVVPKSIVIDLPPTPTLDDLPDPFTSSLSPQARDRAGIAAAQGGGLGHGEEFFFGLPGGGGRSILSKLGGGSRGPGMGEFASLTRGPRDTNRYAHGKKPGPMGPNPASGKSTGGTKTGQTARGPNPSGMAPANPPASRSTDKDQGFAKTGPVDRGPSSGPTVVQGTTGGGGGGSIQVTTPAPNPPADKSSGGTTTKPTTPGPNPTPDRSSGGTTSKGSGGGTGSGGSGGGRGGGNQPQAPAAQPTTLTVSQQKEEEKKKEQREAVEKDAERKKAEKKPGGHGSNPNPEDTGSGGGGPGGPRQGRGGGHNENPNPEDTGGGRGGGGPRAYGGSSRSNLAGPRSYDAYPDPESSGGGGPRGRYNERPNPEDTGSPHGPSARNRNAIGPWSASRNRMI